MTYDLDSLLAEQDKLEQEATAQGEALFFARLDKAADRGQYAEAAPVRKLMTRGIRPVADALQLWVDAQEHQRGTRHTALKWVQEVGVREAAYLALRVVLDGLLETRTENAVARRIADLMTDELKLRRIKKQAPQAFAYQTRRLAEKASAHYQHRASTLLKTAKLEEIDLSDLKMTEAERIHVGYKLLDVVLTVTGLCDCVRVTRRDGRKVVTDRLLRPEEQTLAWLEKRSDYLAMLSPMALPMVVPPIEWTHDQQGGYRFGLRARYPLVRRVKGDQLASEVPAVYDALNAAQGTAWRVNPKVWAIVCALRADALELPGNATEPLDLPAKPHDIDENEEARKAWRKAAATVHQENNLRVQAKRSTEAMLSVAQRMAQYPALYFPHSLDFRGRLYPIPAYFHPQGPDLCRGLLEFAEAVPVGQEGRKWIAIHLANTYGETPGGQKVSKMALAERVRWVEENTAVICAVAADPLGCRWWQGAEEPWQCLAACIEWAGVVREGVSYASRLPTAMDGSCNGLQHLAMMMRDQRAGSAVNLVPHTLPADVYTDVVEEAKAICARLIAVSNPDTLTKEQRKLYDMQAELGLARRWLASGLMGRKLSKTPTMTVAYGSRVYGFREVTAEYLKGQPASVIAEHFLNDEGDQIIGKAAQFMAEVLFAAMADAIEGPMKAMDWMQDCADIVAQDSKPVVWTVQGTGWRVSQAYWSMKQRQVKTMLAGQVVMPVVAEATDKLDTRRQRNGIAPNIVHSLDAACLMLAVQRARNEGVEAFGLIHDSYACHAAHAPVLARAARQAFVSIYSQPVLENLRTEFQAQTTEELPPVPAQGDLDLGGVLVSDFFFA